MRSVSKVITDHVEKDSEAREPEMINYLEAIHAMENTSKGFQSFTSQEHKMTKLTNLQRQRPESNPCLKMSFVKKSQDLQYNKRKKNKSMPSSAKIGDHP